MEEYVVRMLDKKGKTEQFIKLILKIFKDNDINIIDRIGIIKRYILIKKIITFLSL